MPAHPEDFVEEVLAIVEAIPPGRVTTYGTIAQALGRYGARRVGNVMATHGGGVPWWRVVRADGSLPPSHETEAGEHYRAEGTPLKRSGSIEMREAFWEPSDGGQPVGSVDNPVEPEECSPNPLREGSKRA